MVFSSLNQSLRLVGSGFLDNNRYASIPIPKMETAKKIKKLQVAQKQAQPTTTTPLKTTTAKIDINQEEDASTNDGNPQVEELSSDGTLKSEDETKDDLQDVED